MQRDIWLAVIHPMERSDDGRLMVHGGHNHSRDQSNGSFDQNSEPYVQKFKVTNSLFVLTKVDPRDVPQERSQSVTLLMVLLVPLLV